MVAQETDPTELLRQQLQVQSPADTVEWINLLIYGEAGVGKTFFIGSADDDPRLRPLLIFDIEGGMTTLKNKPEIDVVPVRSIPEIEEKYNRLYHSIRHENGKPFLHYKTIAIDSLTELADLDMRQEMKKAYQAKPDRVNIDVPSPREWGIVRNHIRLIVRAFKDLPCHTIFAAGLGMTQPEGELPKYHPGFAGKLAREVPGFADIVAYYSSKSKQGNVSRFMQVVGTDRVTAKDRTSALGQMVENPTLSMIWDIVEGIEMQPEAPLPDEAGYTPNAEHEDEGN